MRQKTLQLIQIQKKVTRTIDSLGREYEKADRAKAARLLNGVKDAIERHDHSQASILAQEALVAAGVSLLDTAPRVFISHSSKDRRFVEREIIEPMNRQGIDTWYSKDDIRTAEQFGESIKRALNSCNWLLVVISVNSANSQWVKSEVEWAFSRIPDHVVPVLIDESDPVELHLRMNLLQYIDFREDRDMARIRLLSTWGA